MYGRWEVEVGEVHTGFWCGDLRETDHLEDLGVDVKIVLKRILEFIWIRIDSLRALVKAMMNIWVLQNVENLLTS
jgi:hypothetical protein